MYITLQLQYVILHGEILSDGFDSVLYYSWT